MSEPKILLKLAHSPDPDDAFMWWPLMELDGKPSRIDTGRFRFEAVMQDIEILKELPRNATGKIMRRGVGVESEVG